MADQRDHKTKEEIAKGMSKSSQETSGKGKVGTGEKGSDKVTEGMSEAGRHPTQPGEKTPKSDSK